ncbi:MAG: aminoacyl-tRNA hydrolase [Patescibacteria group bacterium]
MSYIIVGLGNPGEEYKDTRHNAGRIVLEYFAQKHALPEFKQHIKSKALVSKGEITVGNTTENVELVEPNNFMNRSGSSVATLAGIGMLTSKASATKKAHNIIVIYDDLDLPLGSIKISFNRSSGGHRGVESIIKSVKTQEFIRVRVGICPLTPAGKPKKPQGETDVEKFIIGPFKKNELEELNKIAKDVAEALELIMFETKERAMEKFN